MRTFVSKYFMLFLFALMLFAQPISAKVDDSFGNGNQLCLNATQKYEEKYQIKQHLLTTISNVETGRFSTETQRTTAWPWTINAEGKGQFFTTKAEAVAEVKKLQAKGVKSIDIGCMQINLLYHGDAFASIEEAFEPQKNVEYAAQFLTSLYETKGKSWDKAAMAYHSSEPTKAKRYKSKIDIHFELVKNFAPQIDKIAQQPKPIKIARVDPQPHIMLEEKVSKKRNNLNAQAWREARLEEYRKNRVRAN